jgi:hypothetical protein
LIELYNIWANHESITRLKIPLFENIIGLILGDSLGDELMGKKKRHYHNRNKR